MIVEPGLPVEVTDRIMPGIVSIPHGFGHGLDGTRITIAGRRPGVNVNTLIPPDVDALSGTSVMNGIPVTLEPGH